MGKGLYYLRLMLFRIRFRLLNKHNYIIPENIFPIDKVRIGKYSYGPLTVYAWGTENEELKIGNFVSIARGVKFILGGNHRLDTISTYPFKKKFMGYKVESLSKGSIIVEDDVWIGMDSLILSNVRIGKGAVVGAGSVVSKDVPPYAIVAGNPARVVRYRFSEDLINKLISIDLVELLDDSFVRANIDLLYRPLDPIILDEILKKRNSMQERKS